MWRAFLGARRSWLDTLYERSYSMQMGEVSLLTSKLFMVNDPACVRHVMQDAHAQYPKHKLLHEALRPLLGDSIFTTNGEQWRRQRQMMNPSFGQARIQVAFTHMQAATQAMIVRMQKWDLTQPHDVQEEMTLVAADIIFRTIFSRGIEEGPARIIFKEFTRYQELAPKLMLPALYKLGWISSWAYRSKSADAAQTIRQLLQGMIAPRLAAHREKSAHPSYAPSDILDSLLDARDEKTGESFGADELLDQIAMLFLAGHETSASAMAWGIHLLSHSKDTQERMHHESLEATQGQAIRAENLRDLPLTWNVFKEALRLFPPVGFIARSVSKPDQLRGKSIEPGDSMIVSPWLIHRHRQLWEEPDSFNPDRFSQDEGSVDDTRPSLRDTYLPFGSGPRVCIGASFAMQEAVLVLNTLIQHYRLSPSLGHTPQPVGRLTIRSENGILVRIQRRSKE
jgi:cytochrome P450